jgi:hypothetical protein
VPDDLSREEHLDELKDHLLSEIERLQATGMDQGEAFEAATTRLGEAHMLMSEYSKNRSFISRLCALDRRMSGTALITDSAARKHVKRLILGHAILWATGLVACTVLMLDAENVTPMATLVFVPLWFASYLLITNSFKALQRDT